MHKYLLILLLIVGLKSYSQAPLRVPTIIATKNLVPPGDTAVNPSYLGELRYKNSDNTLYYAQAFTGRKWVPAWRLLTIMSVGGGVSIISPLSTFDSLKVKTPTSLDNSVIIVGTDTTFDLSITPTITTITTGSSSTLTQSKVKYVRFNPASAISTYTLTLPSSPQQGDRVVLIGGGTITTGTVVTTLTVSAGATIIGTAATSLTVGTTIKYFNDGTVWIRE